MLSNPGEDRNARWAAHSHLDVDGKLAAVSNAFQEQVSASATRRGGLEGFWYTQDGLERALLRAEQASAPKSKAALARRKAKDVLAQRKVKDALAADAPPPGPFVPKSRPLTVSVALNIERLLRDLEVYQREATKIMHRV